MRFNPNNGSPIVSCYENKASATGVDVRLIPYSAVQPDTRTYLSTPVVTAKLNTDNENVTNSIDVSWDAVENAGSYVVTATPSTGESVSETVTTTLSPVVTAVLSTAIENNGASAANAVAEKTETSIATQRSNENIFFIKDSSYLFLLFVLSTFSL